MRWTLDSPDYKPYVVANELLIATFSGEDIQPLVSVNVLEKCVNKCLHSTTTYLLDAAAADDDDIVPS